MHTPSIVLVAGLVLLGLPVHAQVASTTPPPPKPTLAELGMLIYPAQGQTPEQQADDAEACSIWAETETGIVLTTGTPDAAAAGEAAAAQAEQATRGAAVGGAARGAVAGVAIGAIAGNAGKGAAIGAAAGAMGGLSARRSAIRQAETAGAQQAQAGNQALVDQFKRAAQVCLQGRGYTVG
ncbi:MAG TPA: glycine zipper family protein [Longimicrobiales bacterium]|nr:glycine zipper family protein [Longimicrobiales bacterium]